MSLPQYSPFPFTKNTDLDTDGASQYTLRTVDTPLLSDTSSVRSYGAVPPETPVGFGISRHRPLLTAALKCAAIFILSSLLLGGTLWLALPTIDQEDRQYLHIPKSFAQLQDLNALLKKYRDIHPYRVVICYIVVYLFLQAFSLPGSMYLSILGGAVYGMPRAILLACSCVATGATLCYLLSAAFGPALLTLPKWRLRLDRWSETVEAQRSNLYSFMIILRISPFPPHWVVNVLCPHLRIGLVPFWVSTFLGIMGVTVIHTAIGGGLDQMTSADDFHLISWRNFALLASIAFAVLIPVGLRHVLQVKPPIPPSPTLTATSVDIDTISIESDEFALPAPIYKDNVNDTPYRDIEHGDDTSSQNGDLIKVADEIDRVSDSSSDIFIASGGPEERK